MRIGSNERISKPDVVLSTSYARKELEIDLVDNSPRRRNSLEVCERLLTPLQERVPFHVSMVFYVEIELKSIRVCSRYVNLDGMVNDQIDWNLWIHLFGVTSHLNHSVSKSSKVDNCRNASEILKDNSRWTERNLSSITVRLPACNGFDILFSNQKAITVTKRTFQQNTHRIRKMLRWNTSIIKG